MSNQDDSVVESWLPMVGHEEQFKISNLGRVIGITGRNCGKLRSFDKSSCGYSRLKIHLGNRDRYARPMLHRLVWRTFRGEIPKGMEINHIDGDKGNNALSNLELVTRSQNMLHAYANGLVRNYKQPQRKLTADQVREIRSAEPYPRHRVALAKKYGVTPNTITAVLLRETWKDIA